MTYTRVLPSLLNKTSCIPFYVAIFRDSSKAMASASKTVVEESKKFDLLIGSCPKWFRKHIP